MGVFDASGDSIPLMFLSEVHPEASSMLKNNT